METHARKVAKKEEGHCLKVARAVELAVAMVAKASEKVVQAALKPYFTQMYNVRSMEKA